MWTLLLTLRLQLWQRTTMFRKTHSGSVRAGESGRSAAEETRSSGRPTGHPRSRRLADTLIATATTLLLLVLWQVAVDVTHVSSRVITGPLQVAQTLVEEWDILWPAASLTAVEGFLGFFIAVPLGIAFGVCLYASHALRAGLYPLLTFLQTLPLITIAPLFIIWFGFEPVGKVVMVAMLSLFPVAIGTYRGLASVPSYFSDVALTCGAGKLWTLFHVKMRVAARQILSGMRISAVYVFGTAVTAEYLGAQNGLGITLQAAFNSFRTPLVLAVTVLVVALTGLLTGLVALVNSLWLGRDDDNFDM